MVFCTHLATLDEKGGLNLVTGLLLSAGKSERLPKSKPLLKFGSFTFIEDALNTLTNSAIEMVVVVLGHQWKELKNSINTDKIKGFNKIRFIVNPSYKEGKFRSLQFGVNYLLANFPEMEGSVISMVDHPGIKTETINSLINAFKGDLVDVAVPVLKSKTRTKKGHPIVISNKIMQKIREADTKEDRFDDIILQAKSGTISVAVGDEAILRNINTDKAYRSLLEEMRFT